MPFTSLASLRHTLLAGYHEIQQKKTRGSLWSESWDENFWRNSLLGDRDGLGWGGQDPNQEPCSGVWRRQTHCPALHCPHSPKRFHWNKAPKTILKGKKKWIEFLMIFLTYACLSPEFESHNGCLNRIGHQIPDQNRLSELSESSISWESPLSEFSKDGGFSKILLFAQPF